MEDFTSHKLRRNLTEFIYKYMHPFTDISKKMNEIHPRESIKTHIPTSIYIIKKHSIAFPRDSLFIEIIEIFEICNLRMDLF